MISMPNSFHLFLITVLINVTCGLNNARKQKMQPWITVVHFFLAYFGINSSHNFSSSLFLSLLLVTHTTQCLMEKVALVKHVL